MRNALVKSVARCVCLLLVAAPVWANAGVAPNFLVIVADDLGFSDLGAFGGEIETPNLDQLARNGIRMTGFHTESACAPTRAMLMTGSYSHRVGLGNMPESMQANQANKPGYEGYLRTDVATLAERLDAVGYRTLMAGKWHLGAQPEHDPHARGFQHSYAMLQCCHNHFGVGISADPTKMSGYREDGVAVTSLPQDFYSSDFFADKLIEQLDRSRNGPRGEAPFFAYLAFTAPHAPLQAPAATIEKYAALYAQGYETLREQRLKRQVELGLLAESVVAHPLVDAVPWSDLAEADQRVAAREMAIYAAMVDEMDQAVGRVVAALERSGELDNTVIIFLSDNGAESRYTQYGPPWTVANMSKMGSATGYVQYGPGWAHAASAPSWRFKTFATEGGTRSVAFVAGPAVKRPGTIATDYTNVMDIVPTVMELAGVPLDNSPSGVPSVPPIDGLSWVGLLRDGAAVYPVERAIGSELFGSRSLRRGDWKLTDIGDGRWRLFNVAHDPGETTDLSSQQPDLKSDLITAWDAYATDVGVVLPDPPRHPNKPTSWDP